MMLFVKVMAERTQNNNIGWEIILLYRESLTGIEKVLNVAYIVEYHYLTSFLRIWEKIKNEIIYRVSALNE